MPLIALLPIALLILAAYGCWSLMMGVFNPLHFAQIVGIPLAAILGIVLAFRFGSAAIERWKARK